MPDNDAFWPIAVYGDDGFMKSDNIINDRKVVLDNDGRFTVDFGSEGHFGDKPNRVDMTTGWNFLMPVYPPGPFVLNREYVLPAAEIMN